MEYYVAPAMEVVDEMEAAADDVASTLDAYGKSIDSLADLIPAVNQSEFDPVVQDVWQ